MPLIRRRWVPFPLEDMAQVSPTLRAHNLRPRHAERAVSVPFDRARYAVKICGPAAAGLELVGSAVERGGAGCAGLSSILQVSLLRFRHIRTCSNGGKGGQK